MLSISTMFMVVAYDKRLETWTVVTCLSVMAFTCDVGLGKRDPVQRTVVKEVRPPSARHVKAPFSAWSVFVYIIILLPLTHSLERR
jgi:hypothetical protein